MPLVQSSSSERVWQIDSVDDVVLLHGEVRRFASALGFTKRAQWEIAIAVSEAATNMVKHAGGGTLTLRQIDEPFAGVELVARDHGPGIAEPELARRDHVSRGVDLTKVERRRAALGLGTGLGAIERLTDEMTWENLGPGGRLTARKRLAKNR